MSSGDRSIDDLKAVTAKEFNISSCNSANPDTYNVVYGFMQITNISGTITGFDGGARWDENLGDHTRGGGEKVTDGFWGVIDPWHYVKSYQHTWWKHVEKSNGVPIRTRQGRRYFQ